LLVERPGDLVTRDELRQRLWPTGTFGDFDHGLNAVINRLRDTLGDSADSPRFIETLPRRGYRFIAPIEPDHEPSRRAPEASGHAERPPEGRPCAGRPGAVVAALAWVSSQWSRGHCGNCGVHPAGEGPPPRVVSITRLAGRRGLAGLFS
jgi:hypothetical protein